MFLSDKNEIIDKMKEHTTISPHAISDLHYHIARNNMDVVAHICKFFGMKVHILSDGFTILEKIEMKDNIDHPHPAKVYGKYMDKIIHTTITELLGTLLKEKILTADEAAKYLVAYDSLFEYVEKVEKNINGSIEIVASSVEEMTAYTQLIITMNATDSDCKSIW